MIHVESITAALYTQLSSAALLVSSGFTIAEGEPLNQALAHTPWVGVYYGALEIRPHTLGGQTPWQGALELLLYVQDGSHGSGQEATRLLGRAQSAVLDALDADHTLGGAVLTLTGLELAPYRRDVADNSWLFTNELLLRADVRG